MLESINSDALEYVKMSPEEMKSRGILGRLTGPCCDTIRPTRNDRLYSEELWEKVFDSPLVKEQFEAGGIFGELTHPDREEVALEKVAISMPNAPKKNKDGLLIGVWDILDTPCGRILKTLCDYGYAVGISTRGTGDIVTDYDGNECVDPDTYTLNALDIVTIPAVKAARLHYVTESVSNKESLSESLQKLVEKSNDSDKKIITETLKDLEIHLSSTEEDVNIDASDSNTAAEDNGASVVKNLQTALKENKALQAQIVQLQEKLSVCYAKEAKFEEANDKCKNVSSQLSRSQKMVESLKARISSLYKKINSLNESFSEKEKEVRSLTEELNNSRKKLLESVSSKDMSIKALSTKLSQLSEDSKQKIAESDAKCAKLQARLQEQMKDSDAKNAELSRKLNHSNGLVEKYKAIAKNAVEKYISTQAIRLGVKPEEIKSRLREGYTFNDIDTICEEIQDYHISVSKLPFSLDKKQTVGVSITESKEPIKGASCFDDEVDDSLMELANVK